MLANLRALFGVVIDIVLLRRGPEHLPASQALLVVMAVVSTVANALLVVALGVGIGPALLMCAVASVVMVAWFRFLLSMANKRERFLQTLTALFSISALFLPLLIPVLPPLAPYFENPQPAEPPPALPMLIGAAIGFWALLLEIRIVRAAFECPWVVAIMLVLSEIFVSNIVGMILFGGGKPA
ncbi:MAG TPA: hypothetical protein VM146_13605 [Steroidobacteraceae bacterium]|nr:hypothetical protein [Steroidobacteraceae bacterium]